MDYCAASFTGLVTDPHEQEKGTWFKLGIDSFSSYHNKSSGELPAFYPKNLATLTLNHGDKILCRGRLRQYASRYNSTADRAPSLILVCEEAIFLYHVPMKKTDPPILGGLRTESGGQGQQKGTSDAINIESEWNPFNPDLTWWDGR